MNLVEFARRSAVLLLPVAFVGFCGSNPAAQTTVTTTEAAATAATLPDAAVVLKKFRTAIGGEAAIRKHTARTVTGHFELPAQGMKGELKIVAAAPDRM